MNAKTATAWTAAALLLAAYAEARPILSSASEQTQPHPHWYTATIGNRTQECTPSDTPRQRRNIGRWITLTPTIAVWHHHGLHTLKIRHNPNPVTIVISDHHRIDHLIRLQPQNTTDWAYRQNYWLILPGNPKINAGDEITITRHHVDEWDY